MSEMSEVLIYEAEGGQTQVSVRLEAETVWLTQEQMAALFGRERSVVTKHLRNVFKEGELEENSVCANFAHTASDGKTYETKFYNLDAVISVGYRVNSKQGTRFRQWATRTLREHLVQGYTLNQTRLAERGIGEAQQAIELLARTLNNQALVSDAGSVVLALIVDYAKTWRLLLQYDESGLVLPESCKPAQGALDYDRALAAIAKLKAELMARGEATPLFGQARGEAFLATSSRRCSENRCIAPEKKKRRTCCISSSRIIRSRTATSASVRSCFCSTFSRKI
jgi:hypothetical protein